MKIRNIISGSAARESYVVVAALVNPLAVRRRRSIHLFGRSWDVELTGVGAECRVNVHGMTFQLLGAVVTEVVSLASGVQESQETRLQARQVAEVVLRAAG